MKQVILWEKERCGYPHKRKRQFRCDKHLKNIWLEGRTCDLPWRYFKTVAAVLAVKLIFGRTYTENIILLELYAGFGAVLGHNFPFYLKFKGGKGVACTGGMVLAVFPIVAPVSMGLFLVISAVTKYVSLGSIIGLISVFVQVVVYGQLGIITVPMGIRAEFYIVTACFTILGVWQHRANIRRLANGTENKIGAKKKEQK